MILLGTGTCQLETSRRASSVLLEVGGARVLYDLGRGIADRLVEVGLRQDDLRHVVFSHFHPDHVSDLVPYLHAAAWSRIDPRTEDLHLYGPPGLKRLVDNILETFGRSALVRDPWKLRVQEIGPGILDIEGVSFELEHLPPSGNHGLKVEVGGRTVALTGDSDFHPAEVDFLRGVDLGVFDSGHLTDAQIVDLATQSGARYLVCSHVYRELDLQRLQEAAESRGFRGRLAASRDLLELPLHPWGVEEVLERERG